MDKRNSKKNFIWNALGLTFNSFNSLFFLIAVKLINGLDIAGIFTYAFSLCCLFYVLSMYYNRTFQVSDKHNAFSFNQYLTARILLSIISLILIVAFSLVSQFDGYKILVIFLIMMFRVVESISDCFYAFIQRKGELYKTGISLTLKALIGLSGFIFLDLLTGNLLLSIISLIIINLLFFWFYDLKNYHKFTNIKINLDFHNVGLLLKKCFPVFIFSALSIYLANCQKYVMTYFEPNEVQTIFGILIMPATVLSLAGAYLINPFVNRMTDLKHQNKMNAFIKLAAQIIVALVVISLIAIIACYYMGIPILNFIYQMNLDEFRIWLIIVLLGAVFQSLTLVLSNFLTILKENFWQSIIYVIAALLSTIISVVMISTDGIYGGIKSFLASSVVLFVLYAILFITTIARCKKCQK